MSKIQINMLRGENQPLEPPSKPNFWFVKNIFYCCTVFLSSIDVVLNSSQRVYDGYFSTTFYIVSSLRQASCIYLFYIHNLCFYFFVRLMYVVGVLFLIFSITRFKIVNSTIHSHKEMIYLYDLKNFTSE